ncbi:multiple sugar transport system permease protein [Salibacterium salarium]|uniref:Carbohydrate ABC transporter permease n=1 Tax=Salibacterium salarium TaxID=284579 RepID=A0A3R9PB12_9BACI|nr:carbohydrate ABC transporter permease [Salibacterium salarium]MDQ0297987.1 multiple sugar transport system permease protein [Salibacterium salarium]RSL35332.1 carbohydrate ABC transporter permease [Salibacterium salarium]
MKKRQKEWLLNILGIFIVFVFLFPFFWMIVTSFKTQSEIFQIPPTFLPVDWQFESYQEIMQNNIVQNFFNSLLISSLTTLVVLLLSVPSAYGLARFSIRGKELFILLFLVTQMLPATVILTPLFILFNQMGILNSYAGPILACATLGIPFSVLILRTFFLGIPRELEDAAKIDGCNPLSAFVRIVMPLAMPSIIVCGAVSFFFTWGDLIFSITFNRSQELWPLTAGIYNAIGQYGIEWNSLMAFATISALPVLIIFILLQKRLVKGLASGAVK